MTKQAAPLTYAVQWAKEALTAAGKAFGKNPNSTNWDVLQRAAFTFQQVEWASRSTSVDRSKLSIDLAVRPVGEWQDIICRTTVGTGVRDSLRDFANN